MYLIQSTGSRGPLRGSEPRNSKILKDSNFPNG
jgi:hypothetical protein